MVSLAVTDNWNTFVELWSENIHRIKNTRKNTFSSFCFAFFLFFSNRQTSSAINWYWTLIMMSIKRLAHSKSERGKIQICFIFISSLLFERTLSIYFFVFNFLDLPCIGKILMEKIFIRDDHFAMAEGKSAKKMAIGCKCENKKSIE